MNPDKLLRAPELIRTNEVAFFEAVLGLPISYHKGQVKWSENSNKTINILRPGNKWGKSLFGGARHTRHLATKPLAPQNLSDEDWLKFEYETLNFGPGYEQSREILRMARKIIQGEIFIPEAFQKLINPYTGDEYGVTNKSMLKDWFIEEDRSESQQLPYIGTWTGARLLARSYDQMGQAFKMKAITYASGDECADIKDLWTFTNGTLLPRMVTVKNPQIDYYGTPQPEGHDYLIMIEMAEEDMQRPDYKEHGRWYVQKGSMYENVFIPKETIQEIEAIADPTLRKQIIDGEYVETGEKYFGYQRVQNMVSDRMELLEYGSPGRKYMTAVDFAGGESAWADYTVIITVDYTQEPYTVVQFERFKGGDVGIPMQYKRVEEIVLAFGGKGRLLVDSSALGGKNAMAFLSHLNPISVDFSTRIKGEMLGSLKIAMDGGTSEERKRKRIKNDDGDFVDVVKDWGNIRMPNIPIMLGELQNYKLDDAKIRQDCVMTLAMLIHWIELRRPKKQRNSAVDWDPLG